MKKPQVRGCKAILEKRGGVLCATNLIHEMLKTVDALFAYTGYAEKELLPEQVAKIYMGLEQMKEVFEITDEEIDTEINYALEVAENENLDLK